MCLPGNHFITLVFHYILLQKENETNEMVVVYTESCLALIKSFLKNVRFSGCLVVYLQKIFSLAL